MRGLGRSAEHSLHHCKELQLQRWIGLQWIGLQLIGLPKSAISTADRTESPAQKVGS